MSRKDYATLLFDGKLTVNQVPETWLRTFQKRAYAFLGLNRYCRPTIYNQPKDLIIAQRYENVLVQMGFTVTVTKCVKGDNFWRKIRNQPVNGTLAIENCSHWFMIDRDHVSVCIKAPDNNMYAQPHSERYYVDTKKGGWYTGYLGNPFVISHPQFNAKLMAEGWQEPFHGIKNVAGQLYDDRSLIAIDRYVPDTGYVKKPKE